jgi:hypothetical protein
MKLDFIDIFSENTQRWNFTKIRPVEADLFHVEGRMDE